MKKYPILILAMLATLTILSLVAFSAANNPAAAATPNSTTVAPYVGTPSAGSASTMAMAEPVDPVLMAKLKLQWARSADPIPAGWTTSGKTGPVGLLRAVSSLETGAAPAPAARWFDTQEQALAALKTLAPNSIVLGVLYENAPPGGRALTIYGPDCNNQGVSNLGGYNFDNITSSLDNSCGTATLYSDPNYGEAQQSYPNGRTANVGTAMNDQASSVNFTP